MAADPSGTTALTAVTSFVDNLLAGMPSAQRAAAVQAIVALRGE